MIDLVVRLVLACATAALAARLVLALQPVPCAPPSAPRPRPRPASPPLPNVDGDVEIAATREARAALRAYVAALASVDARITATAC